MSALTGPAPRRVSAGALVTLGPDVVRLIALAPDRHGKPREAIVLRDDTGELRAYRNQCRHLPVPLDSGSRRFVVAGRIECATHGARYRKNDGYCDAGPCKGASLHTFVIEIVADEIFLIDDDADDLEWL